MTTNGRYRYFIKEWEVGDGSGLNNLHNYDTGHLVSLHIFFKFMQSRFISDG